MTKEDLEQAIRDYIVEDYEKVYIGKMWIEELFYHDGSHRGYLLKLGINSYERPPIEIAIDGDAETFLKYAKQQIHDAGFDEIRYSTATKTYPENYGDCRERP